MANWADKGSIDFDDFLSRLDERCGDVAIGDEKDLETTHMVSCGFMWYHAPRRFNMKCFNIVATLCAKPMRDLRDLATRPAA